MKRQNDNHSPSDVKQTVLLETKFEPERKTLTKNKGFIDRSFNRNQIIKCFLDNSCQWNQIILAHLLL